MQKHKILFQPSLGSVSEAQKTKDNNKRTGLDLIILSLPSVIVCTWSSCPRYILERPAYNCCVHAFWIGPQELCWEPAALHLGLLCPSCIDVASHETSEWSWYLGGGGGADDTHLYHALPSNSTPKPILREREWDKWGLTTWNLILIKGKWDLWGLIQLWSNAWWLKLPRPWTNPGVRTLNCQSNH